MPNNPFMLSEGIDQSTPISDLEKYNQTRYNYGFWEASGDAFHAAVADTIHLATGVAGALTNMDFFQEYGDVVKEDEELATLRSSNYNGGTFLGQTSPQWAGGIAGSLTNPLNYVPYGKIFGVTNKMASSFLTNSMGAVIDSGMRKVLEDRLHEKVTLKDFVENVAAGTILGTGIDALAMKFGGQSKEKLFAPPVKEEAVMSTAMTRFESGVPSNASKIKNAYEPKYQSKLDVFSDGALGESVIVAHADGSISIETANLQGVKKVDRIDTTSYKAGGLEFDSLEAANAYANEKGVKVIMTDSDGIAHILNPVDNERMKSEEVADLEKDMDNPNNGFSHSDKEAAEFSQFVDDSVEGQEFKKMEEEFKAIKEKIDNDIKSSKEPSEELLKRQEEMNMAESKMASEESLIKAITSCFLRGLK